MADRRNPEGHGMAFWFGFMAGMFFGLAMASLFAATAVLITLEIL